MKIEKIVKAQEQQDQELPGKNPKKSEFFFNVPKRPQGPQDPLYSIYGTQI